LEPFKGILSYALLYALCPLFCNPGCNKKGNRVMEMDRFCHGLYYCHRVCGEFGRVPDRTASWYRGIGVEKSGDLYLVEVILG